MHSDSAGKKHQRSGDRLDVNGPQQQVGREIEKMADCYCDTYQR